MIDDREKSPIEFLSSSCLNDDQTFKNRLFDFYTDVIKK